MHHALIKEIVVVVAAAFGMIVASFPSSLVDENPHCKTRSFSFAIV